MKALTFSLASSWISTLSVEEENKNIYKGFKSSYQYSGIFMEHYCTSSLCSPVSRWHTLLSWRLWSSRYAAMWAVTSLRAKWHGANGLSEAYTLLIMNPGCKPDNCLLCCLSLMLEWRSPEADNQAILKVLTYEAMVKHPHTTAWAWEKNCRIASTVTAKT